MLQNELYYQLFHNNAQTLTDISNRYPWFSAAHYFKVQQNQTNDLTDAQLHFPNSLLLQYRLAVPELYATVETKEVLNAIPEEPTSEVAVENVDDVHHEVLEEPITDVEPIVEQLPKTEATDTPVTVSTPADEVKVEDKTPSNDLLFEPLHTTDYFASQGIKLSDEIKSGDKLGKQLKSFTEWLKTMKKLPETKENDLPIDKKVEENAENSNKELEIYTETLANVYLEQGKKDKAIEIYKKLILLNPDKNAYFAAKIEELKA